MKTLILRQRLMATGQLTEKIRACQNLYDGTLPEVKIKGRLACKDGEVAHCDDGVWLTEGQVYRIASERTKVYFSATLDGEEYEVKPFQGHYYGWPIVEFWVEV